MDHQELEQKVKAISYWYHRIELPGGIVTPGWSPICAERYAIPEDLTGKRILDIGAWDGYWTWEALKRGASEVVAIDDFSDDCGNPGQVRRNGWETFDLCRVAFGFTENIIPDVPAGVTFYSEIWKKPDICNTQIVSRKQLSVYDISEEKLGRFDIVFFFGTIYHLKHPLLALEKIASICEGEIYIESAICDDFSPYRGGLEHGYRDSEMIQEFYPTHEYGNNESNWWVPTLKCLGYMCQSVGFNHIELWRLTENPTGAQQCRGFVWAGRTEPTNPNILKQAKTASIVQRRPNVLAVMSVPRFGFEDNSSAILETLRPTRIPLLKVWGVFWGQCIERGLQTQIDAGAEILLTIDNDTVFKKEDLLELLALMNEYPEADAIVPIHLGRDGKGALATMRTKTGQRQLDIPMTTFAQDLAPIATGHFGLTVIRMSALMKMDHPWFWAQPDKDGQWGRDRTDEDIYFWRKFSASGNKAFLANRIVVGHIEAVVTWPDQNMQPIYQVLPDWRKQGKPQATWK